MLLDYLFYLQIMPKEMARKRQNECYSFIKSLKLQRGEDQDYGKMVAQYKYEQLDGVKSCSIETTFRIIG